MGDVRARHIQRDGYTADVASSDGTVDFLVAGEPGAFVEDATVYPGGVAYFTQPSNKPNLGVGTYDVTAVFTPSGGSAFATSKTKKSVSLTITALGITPTAEVITDPAIVTVPTVRTSITGTYVDEHGSPPVGEWMITATDSAGDEVFAVSAAQPTESVDGAVGPFDIPITSELEPGETFAVTAVFTPEQAIAAGLEFDDPAPASFTTRALTPTEVLSSPVTLSLWLIILNGVLFIVLVIGLVWLIGTWWRGRARRGAEVDSTQAPAAPAALGSPQHTVEDAESPRS